MMKLSRKESRKHCWCCGWHNELEQATPLEKDGEKGV